MSPEIWSDISGGIAQMRFSKAESRNSLSMQGVGEVIEFLRRVEHDRSVRCLSITGAGPHFMAGGDMKNFLDVLALPEAAQAAHFEQRAIDQAPIWVTLDRLNVPVVCSVRGYAIGGALSFVGAADLAIASDTAKFILGHVGLGLPPDAGASYYLPRSVSLKKAKQMTFFGERVGAEEALAMGLVNWVVPDAELEKKTDEVVARLIKAPSKAIAVGRHLLNQSLTTNLPAQLMAEAEGLAACAKTKDIREGVAAFMEKRPPAFKGE